MGRERTVEQSWAEWEGDLERNRAITSGQYINTHHLKVQLRAVYVCVCHVTVAPNLLAQHVKGSALCFRPVAPGHSGSGSQGEQRNGSSVTVWSWLRQGEGTGQPLPFTKDGQPWSNNPSRLSLPRSRRFGALYPAHQGLCWAGMFWDTSAWSAHSWKSARRSVPTNSPEPGGTHSSAKGVYTRLSWTQAAPRPWSNKPWLSQGYCWRKGGLRIGVCMGTFTNILLRHSGCLW